MSYQLYKLLDTVAGTDYYPCPKYVEEVLKAEVYRRSDEEILSAINKYRNEHKRLPVVSVHSAELQERFDRLLERL